MDATKGYFCICSEVDVDKHHFSDKNLLVLHSHPEVDYYDDINDGSSTPYEHHLFVLTKNQGRFIDKVFKHLFEFEKAKNIDTHIYPAQIIFNETKENFLGLRFRENMFEILKEFLNILQEKEGFVFLKDMRFKRKTAQIFYRRYMELVPFVEEEKIYKNRCSNYVYSIEIPEELEFTRFKRIVKDLRNTPGIFSFEACQAHILCDYQKYVYYFVIYSRSADRESLINFKNTLYRKLMIE